MVVVDTYATALTAAVAVALPGWVERAVERALVGAGRIADPLVVERTQEAGRQARDEVVPRLEALLSTDIDDQRTTPLAIVRQAVRYPTEVLQEAGVPASERDPQQQRLFPTDIYDLSPATFADIDANVADAGLAWGAAKAYTHLQRHGDRGGHREAEQGRDVQR